MSTKNTTPTTLANSELSKVIYYLHDGVQYATASNWRKMSLQPKATAKGIEVSTKYENGFTIFAKADTEKYDAKAAEATKEAEKERKKQLTELHKLFMTHEIGLADYTTALAQLA